MRRNQQNEGWTLITSLDSVQFWRNNRLNDKQVEFSKRVVDTWLASWSKTLKPRALLKLHFNPTVTNLADCVDLEITWEDKSRTKTSLYHWDLIDNYLYDAVSDRVLTWRVCTLIQQLEREALDDGRFRPLILTPPEPIEDESDA